jgi:hypothetical protein
MTALPTPIRISPVTLNPPENDHLPVYESLVRERGDAVAEARVVAEETHHQVTQALNWHAAVQPEHES